MRSFLAILLIGLGLTGSTGRLQAQDLSGQWTGTAVDPQANKDQKLVLNIAQGDSSFGGVLHWYFPEARFIGHLIVSGRYYRRDSVLTIREDSISNDGLRAGARPERTRGFYVLYYRRNGRKEYLEGHWKDPKQGKDASANLDIHLEKKAPAFIPVAMVTHRKKDSAVSQKQVQALLSRESPVVASIPVHGVDSVRIDLYDNGEIDGDSISLFLNGELILQHIRLAAQPKTLFLAIDKSQPVNRLILFAENLGRLPPNTALMEVSVKGKRYDLFLSTDYTRNASVEFILQE
jgi:hypothetical protein